MDRKVELEARLAALRAELGTVEGGPTEVYSRIVGYYRSVRNWNAGKREEYHARLTYGLPARPEAAGRLEAAVGTERPAVQAMPASVPSVALRHAAQAALGLELGGEAGGAGGASAGQGLSFKAAASRSGILVFTRKACPNCPPVADYVTKAGLPAIFVDVDGEEGLALARRHGVMATPTVLGLDGEGREAFRACGIHEVKARLPATV